jgi:hypothetical protein
MTQPANPNESGHFKPISILLKTYDAQVFIRPDGCILCHETMQVFSVKLAINRIDEPMGILDFGLT